MSDKDLKLARELQQQEDKRLRNIKRTTKEDAGKVAQAKEDQKAFDYLTKNANTKDSLGRTLIYINYNPPKHPSGYESIDEAVIAGYKYKNNEELYQSLNHDFNPSISVGLKNSEIIGLIFKYNKRYYYTSVIRAGNINNIRVEVMNPRRNIVQVAHFHSHPYGYSPWISSTFSGGDADVVKTSKSQSFAHYLRTPGGDVRKLTKKTISCTSHAETTKKGRKLIQKNRSVRHPGVSIMKGKRLTKIRGYNPYYTYYTHKPRIFKRKIYLGCHTGRRTTRSGSRGPMGTNSHLE